MHVFVALLGFLEAGVGDVERRAVAVGRILRRVDIAAALQFLYVLLGPKQRSENELVVRQVVPFQQVRPRIADGIQLTRRARAEVRDRMRQRVHHVVLAVLDMNHLAAHVLHGLTVGRNTLQARLRCRGQVMVVAVVELGGKTETPARIADQRTLMRVVSVLAREGRARLVFGNGLLFRPVVQPCVQAVRAPEKQDAQYESQRQIERAFALHEVWPLRHVREANLLYRSRLVIHSLS